MDKIINPSLLSKYLTFLSATKIFFAISNLKFEEVIILFWLIALELPSVNIISSFFKYVALSEKTVRFMLLSINFTFPFAFKIFFDLL